MLVDHTGAVFHVVTHMPHRFLPRTIPLVVLAFALAGAHGCAQDAAVDPDTDNVGGQAGATGGSGGSCTADVPESTSSRCTDGCDNDESGMADCEDPNCCALSLSCGGSTLCGQRTDGNDFSGALAFDDGAMAGIEPATLPSGAYPCREPQLVRVEYTIDGDTIDVTEVGGLQSERVRVIGVDTPEVAHTGSSAECFGDEAAEFTMQLAGHLVWLTFDAECRDSYDRLLAYVYMGEGRNDSLERQLLQRGFARAYPYGNNRTFQYLYESDEQSAQDESLGLWGACPERAGSFRSELDQSWSCHHHFGLFSMNDWSASYFGEFCRGWEAHSLQV